MTINGKQILGAIVLAIVAFWTGTQYASHSESQRVIAVETEVSKHTPTNVIEKSIATTSDVAKEHNIAQQPKAMSETYESSPTDNNEKKVAQLVNKLHAQERKFDRMAKVMKRH